MIEIIFHFIPIEQARSIARGLSKSPFASFSALHFVFHRQYFIGDRKGPSSEDSKSAEMEGMCHPSASGRARNC